MNNSDTISDNFDNFQQHDLPITDTENSNKTIFGLLLISAGALMLLNNLVPMINLKKMWPAILIIIGLGLIFQKSKKENKSGQL
jgi:phage shock protein C